MNSHSLPLTSLRTAIARHLRVPLAWVRPDHVLHADLDVDVIDLAFIAVDIEDMTGVEVVLPDLDRNATVEELAESLAPLFERPIRVRRAGGAR
jgi:acyl carrier protein